MRWPTGIPQQLETGATLTPVDGFRRTPVGAGPARVIGLFSATPRVYTGTLFLGDSEQIRVFQAFFDNPPNHRLIPGTARGRLPFDFQDPEDFSSTIQARFISTPSRRFLVGGRAGVQQVRLNVSLELLP